MEINKLYQQKGQLVTNIELLQGQLNAVNGEINQHLNAQAQAAQPKKEEPAKPGKETTTKNKEEQTP